jgi:long-chain fatty acid transport protein
VCNHIVSPLFSKLKSVCLSLIPLFTLIGQAHANNGLNVIGFGAESLGMAGSDLAVAQDSSALNTNPAGLCQLDSNLLDLNMALAYIGGIRHSDGLGNDVSNSNAQALLGSFGYAHRLTNSPVSVGIGLFGQGGMGSTFEELRTPFGTTDEMSALFRIARLTPGASWQVNEKLSVGGSLMITYSDMQQKLFPDTSFLGASLASSFFGLRIEDMDAIDTGIKLGLMYKPSDRLTLGLSYTSQVDITLDGGTLEADMTALGLGKVSYKQVEMSGLNQPQELGIGLAYQYNPKLLLAMELNWIDWSAAVQQSLLTASDPDNSSAPANLEQITTLNWRDQYVISLGARYAIEPKLVLRAGYNYGRNPIPDDNLSPLLNTIGEHHLTLGFGWTLDNAWNIDGAFEWDIENRVTYTNDALPFGSDTELEGGMLALHFRLSRAW